MPWHELASGPLASIGRTLLAICAGYILGCCTTGYYLMRWRTGGDIRETGSGSVGATNVGRTLGPIGFTATLVVDWVKGACAAFLAIYLGLGPWNLWLAVLAVVAGHIWPAQLRFRGGKGVATLLGALMVADFQVLLLIVSLFLVAFLPLSRFSLSGLAALAVAPVVLVAYGSPAHRVLGFLLPVALVLLAHRQNLRADLDRLQVSLGRKSPANPPVQKE